MTEYNVYYFADFFLLYTIFVSSQSCYSNFPHILVLYADRLATLGDKGLLGLEIYWSLVILQIEIMSTNRNINILNNYLVNYLRWLILTEKPGDWLTFLQFLERKKISFCHAWVAYNKENHIWISRIPPTKINVVWNKQCNIGCFLIQYSFI